jgi:plasmid stability protein
MKGTIMKPYQNQIGETMATNFTLKNIPEDLYKKVRERAERNHRSINGEIISILNAATMSRPFDLDEIIVRAREFRGRTKGFLTEEFLRQAKREGLP